MATNSQGTGATGSLSEDVVESVRVQERDGSYHVTIPKESARDLDISKGDSVIFTGEEGDRSLSLQQPQRFLRSDD